MGDSVKEDKGDVAVASPSEAKKPKMKQANLFDVLKPKAPAPKTQVNPQKLQILSPISNKKRKSTDAFHANQKGAKVAKIDESITKAKRLKVDDSENEVSSSSEPDASKTSLLAAVKENIPETKPPKVKGSLDQFVRITQATEVSTSCAEETVKDLTDGPEENIQEPEQGIPDSSQDDKKEEGNKDQAKEGSSEKKKDERRQDEVKDLNESTLSNTEESMEIDSELDASVATDYDANKTLDSTISDADSPKEKKSQANQKTNGSTPVSRRPKKAVKSSSKKEEQERERQRLKEEREKQKEKEKMEKQKEREAAKAEKERIKKEEKERKEKERAEQKLAKEREKQAKLEQIQKEKEEKQKKKQAEIDAKNEERRKKEEEKKRVEDEKKRAEEEKLAKKKQNEMKFKSFFKHQEKSVAPSPKPEENKSRFMAFQVKENMKMAPAVREMLSSERKSALDEAITKQESNSYLLELKGRQTGKSGKTWPSDDNDVVCVDEEKQKTGTVMKAKFLHFHQNYRPAYYGTWRKSSKYIKPRKPLAQDTELFDYEMDSDDEWEEEEQGESLSHSEKEDEQEEGDDDDEDDDGFFVPHGYLSDDECCDDDEDDVTPERMKARQLAKAKAFEAEMKKQTTAMSSLVIGCIWWNPHTSGSATDPSYNKLAQFAVQPLGTLSYPVDVSCEAVGVSKKETKSKKTKSEDNKGANFQPVPDEAIPDLVRLVHGNNASIQKLIKEFREYWSLKSLGNDGKSTDEANSAEESPMEVNQKSPDVQNTSTSETPTKGNVFSKRQLDMKIKSIAVYEKRDSYKRNCWYVHQKILEEHKLTDLAIPCEWQWITRPNMTPKLEATPKSGRKTPTLTGTPTHAKIQQFAVKMTPEQLAEMMPKPEPKASPAPIKSTPTRTNIQQFAVKMTPEQLAKSMPRKLETKASPPAPAPLNSLQQMLFKNSESNSSTSKVPSVTTIPKSVFEQPDGAIPSTSGTAPKTTTSVLQQMIIDSRKVHYQKKEADISCDSKTVNNKSISNPSMNGDDDCMIVDEEAPALPLVAPKGQPTLFSVLKKTIVK